MPYPYPSAFHHYQNLIHLMFRPHVYLVMDGISIILYKYYFAVFSQKYVCIQTILFSKSVYNFNFWFVTLFLHGPMKWEVLKDPHTLQSYHITDKFNHLLKCSFLKKTHTYALIEDKRISFSSFLNMVISTTICQICPI